MSSEFKPGDRVRCVDRSGRNLTVGAPYTVVSVDPRDGWPNVYDDDSSLQNFNSKRFELLYDEPTSDPVVRPNHYARYTIEPATFIAANKLPFDVGNVVKYVLRFDAKNGIEDLEKARRYIDMTIERLRREARVGDGEDASEVWRAML